MKEYIIFMWLFVLVMCVGVTAPSNSQSLDLSETNFIRQVIAHHPALKAAELGVALGEAEIQAASGQFDPNLGLGFERKFFSDKLYFNKYKATISQPISPFGIDLSGGFEYNNGVNLNPENSSGTLGVGFLGIDIPLISGFLTDQRRTRVTLSKINLEEEKQKFRAAKNDLLFDALNKYWSWITELGKLQLLQEVTTNNQRVLNGIRSSFLAGELAEIDTLEANVQYQRLNILLNNQQITVNLRFNQLRNFIWDENLKTSLNSYTIPIGSTSPEIVSTFTGFEKNMALNPQLRLLEIQRRKLKAEGLLRKEFVKPRLDLQAKILYDPSRTINEQPWFNENYNFGTKLGLPLFFRTARAELEKNRINLDQNELRINDFKFNLQNRLDNIDFTINQLSSQLSLLELLVNDSRKLYEAELQKFDLGESSIFLLVSRENQFLQNTLSLLDLELRNIIENYRLHHLFGRLGDL